MKRINYLLSIAILVFISQVFFTVKAKNKPEKLTVISYNIRNGEAEDGTNSWQYRYHTSAMMIMDQAPDIFGLQEAYDYQFKYLKEFCPGYKGVGVGRVDGKSEGEFMAIFYKKSKIRLIKWGTFWLSETPEKPSKGWDGACIRTATWALMKNRNNGQKFFYVNTHLDHVGQTAREQGLKLIMEQIAKRNKHNLPVVLTGDFNSEPGNPALTYADKVLKNARKTAIETDNEGTFNDWGKLKKRPIIDYIYYDGFSSCPKYETIKKKYDGRTYISDHFPIKAVLIF